MYSGDDRYYTSEEPTGRARLYLLDYIVKVSNGRRSQVANGHLGRPKWSLWPFRPRLKDPP